MPSLKLSCNSPLLVSQKLVGPDRHVQVVHIPAAPTLVAVVVACSRKKGQQGKEASQETKHQK
jgi:hypothetical protein